MICRVYWGEISHLHLEGAITEGVIIHFWKGAPVCHEMKYSTDTVESEVPRDSLLQM